MNAASAAGAGLVVPSAALVVPGVVERQFAAWRRRRARSAVVVDVSAVDWRRQTAVGVEHGGRVMPMPAQVQLERVAVLAGVRAVGAAELTDIRVGLGVTVQHRPTHTPTFDHIRLYHTQCRRHLFVLGARRAGTIF